MNRIILEAKLRVPVLKAGTLKRERLLREIRNRLDRKLVLLTADAGYGKTTLLAQLIREARLPCVFLSLEEGDSDLSVFFSYWTHGLEAVQRGLGRRSRGLLEEGEEAGRNHELLFGTLLNELAAKRHEELFFVLDDYHALAEDSPVHRALDYFVDHLPESVHVLIASRVDPPLSLLAKWRGKGEVFEVTREGLRFTEEEVRALLREGFRMASPEEEIRRMSEKTEGWATGIRLILQSAERGGQGLKDTLNGFLSSDRPLFEYFSEEVFAREREEIREFLLKGAVLEELTGEGCDAVLGREDSGKLLRTLARRHLFVSEIGEGVFRCHPLFREFLLARLGRGEERRALHLRAAEHYRHRKQREQAIPQYLWAGAFEAAIQELLKAADGLFEQARFSQLSSWLEAIPREKLEEHPALLLVRGRLLRAQGRLEEAEQELLRTEARLDRQGPGKAEDRLVRADLAHQRGGLLWLRGAYAEALPILSRGLRVCPRTDRYRRGNLLNLIGIIRMNQGQLDASRKDLKAASRCYEAIGDRRKLLMASSNLAVLISIREGGRAALRSLQRPLAEAGSTYFYQIGSLYASAAMFALNLGEWEEVERLFQRGWALCTPYQDLWSRALLEEVWGKLCFVKGEWAPAQEHFEKALEAYARLGRRQREHVVFLNLARGFRHRKDWKQAERYLDSALERFTKGTRGEIYYLAEKGMLEVSTGRLGQAEETLASCAQLVKRIGSFMEEVLCCLGRALCRLEQGDEAGALRWFRKGVRLARDKGCDGVLAMELFHYPGLQRMVPRCPSERAYLASLPKLPRKEGRVAKPWGLEVRLFGKLEISLPGGKLVPVKMPSRKESSLFAYLLLNRDRLHSKEDLARTFWPGADPERGSQNLYNQVYRLRQALEEGFREAGERGPGKKITLGLKEGAYRLTPGLPIRVDVEEFLECAWQAASLDGESRSAEALESWNRCLSLYPGGFLPKLEEHWAEEVRERCLRTYRTALKKVAACHAEEQEIAQDIVLYRRYFGEDPYDEELRQDFWKALKAVGRRDDIVRDFKELCDRLKKDLKVEPQAKTREVYRELLSS
jgi:ATP/maltotriose-dependent transcriptional regulator MalT/DNA-binding SARP family transcriptional activator